MRISDTIGLSMRMFRTRPMRTMLTILGVSVGIGTVLFLVSVGYGVQQSILERIATADMLLTLDVRSSSESMPMTDVVIDAFRTLPGIDAIVRQQDVQAAVRFGDIMSDTPVSGVDPDMFRLNGMQATWGRLFRKDETTAAVMTSAAAELVGRSPDDLVGTGIVLTFRISSFGSGALTSSSGTYRVVGILENAQESRVFIPLQSLGQASKASYDLAKVKVRSQSDIESVRTSIIDRGMLVSSVSDIIDQANTVFRWVQVALALFGMVALIVSAIGMFNTMTITLLERTSEIGIMRAIGVTPREIRQIFLVESMLMGTLGGIVGVALGMGAGVALNAAINALAAHFGGPQMDIFFAPGWFVALILIFSSTIGLITGVYPSIRASRLNPLDALRYK